MLWKNPFLEETYIKIDKLFSHRVPKKVTFVITLGVIHGSQKASCLRFGVFPFIFFWHWHKMIVRIKLTDDVTNHHEHIEH
jgi:hypothetical protein